MNEPQPQPENAYGRKLRNLRARYGLTLRRTAAMLLTTPAGHELELSATEQLLGRIERGHRVRSEEVAQRIGAALREAFGAVVIPNPPVFDQRAKSPDAPKVEREYPVTLHLPPALFAAASDAAEGCGLTIEQWAQCSLLFCVGRADGDHESRWREWAESQHVAEQRAALVMRPDPNAKPGR